MSNNERKYRTILYSILYVAQDIDALFFSSYKISEKERKGDENAVLLGYLVCE
jgi:hypothetical protein